MQYTEKDLQNLVAAVEKEFTAHLAKAEGDLGSLNKSEDGSKKPFEKKPEGEEKPEGKEAAPAAPAEGAIAKPEGEAAPAAEAAPAEGAPAAAQDGAAQGAGHDYDAEDLEHMKKMYMSMSEGELKAHHDCIASLAKCGAGMGAPAAPAGLGKSEIKDENPTLNSKPKDNATSLDSDKKNGGIEGAQPGSTPGAKSPASKAEGVQMGKSEADRRNGGKIEGSQPSGSPGAKSPASKAEGVQMGKSEENAEVALLKSENDALKKNFEMVSAILTKLVEKKVAPAGKAITTLDVIAKSEGGSEEKSLSKGEIDAALNRKSQDPKLEKSDRDAINAFYLNGASINSISHLLK